MSTITNTGEQLLRIYVYPSTVEECTSRLSLPSLNVFVLAESETHIHAIEAFRQLPWIQRLGRILLASFFGTPAISSCALTHPKRIAIHEHAHTVAVVKQGQVALYPIDRVHNARLPTSLPRFPGKAYCVVFDPCGIGSVAVGTEKGVFLCRRPFPFTHSMSQAKIIQVDPLLQTPIDCIAFHPLGTFIVASGPEIAGFLLCEVSTFACRRLRMMSERVTDLSFSPCGNYIMTVCDFRWVVVWILEKCSFVRQFFCAEGSFVQSAVWSRPSPTATHLLIAYSDSLQMQLCVLDRETHTLHPITISGIVPYVTTMNKSPRLASYSVTKSIVDSDQTVMCVKCMCWEEQGRRLAVVLDEPHPYAGQVVIFWTNSANATFIERIDLQLLSFTAKSRVSTTSRFLLKDGAIEFVIYVNGEVICFQSKLMVIELDSSQSLRGDKSRRIA